MSTAITQAEGAGEAVRRGERSGLVLGAANLAAAFGITWALWGLLLHPNGVLKLYTPMYGFSLVTVLVAVLVAAAPDGVERVAPRAAAAVAGTRRARDRARGRDHGVRRARFLLGVPGALRRHLLQPAARSSRRAAWARSSSTRGRTPPRPSSTSPPRSSGCRWSSRSGSGPGPGGRRRPVSGRSRASPSRRSSRSSPTPSCSTRTSPSSSTRRRSWRASRPGGRTWPRPGARTSTWAGSWRRCPCWWWRRWPGAAGRGGGSVRRADRFAASPRSPARCWWARCSSR